MYLHCFSIPVVTNIAQRAMMEENAPEIVCKWLESFSITWVTERLFS